MSKIEFNFAVDSENADHLRIIGEMFLKLGGSEAPKAFEAIVPAQSIKRETRSGKNATIITESAKVEAPKVEIPKVERVQPEKIEAPKVEAPVETEEKGLTIEALRAKGFALATAKPAAKEAIGNWLKERNIKGVPALPKGLYAEYDEFLSTL
jgi:uncharacterized membrane protein YqiK